MVGDGARVGTPETHQDDIQDSYVLMSCKYMTLTSMNRVKMINCMDDHYQVFGGHVICVNRQGICMCLAMFCNSIFPKA